MKIVRRWCLGLLGCAALLVVAAPGCSTGDDEKKSAALTPGIPCTKNDDCGGTGWCMSDQSVSELSDGGLAVGIPGGYCSALTCNKSFPDEACGEGGYCYDLRQYLPDNPLSICGKTCETEADCRPGYLCHDGALMVDGEVYYSPLPKKACLPPGLLCLLDIATDDCPDAAPPRDGQAPSDGASDASADASTYGG